MTSAEIRRYNYDIALHIIESSGVRDRVNLREDLARPSILLPQFAPEFLLSGRKVQSGVCVY